MKSPEGSYLRGVEDRVFLGLVLVASFAFIWLLRPLYGAILWAVVIAVLFTPLFRSLCKVLRGRYNIAALATLISVVFIVILPLTVLITSLVAEASGVYERMQTGELNLGQYLQRVFDSLPPWAGEFLDRVGLSNVRALRDRFSAGLTEVSRVVAVRAVQLGQNTFSFFLSLFVMLYLLFFLFARR